MAAPINDNFSGILLTTNPFTVTGNNTEATVETGENSRFQGLYSVWYEWIAPARGTLEVTLTGTAFYWIFQMMYGDTLLHSNLIYHQIGNKVTSTMTILVQSGYSYKIRIAGYQLNAYGPFTLTGTFTETFPIHISTPADLDGMRDNLYGDYVLDNNIDMVGVDWEPVAHHDEYFMGTLDGQGYKITNLTCPYSMTNLDGIGGLFGFLGNATAGHWGYTASRAEVKNLTIENFTSYGYYAIGAVAGFICGALIENVHVSNVYIEGHDENGETEEDYIQSAGGLAGDCYGGDPFPSEIRNCSVNNVEIKYAEWLCGGFVGDAMCNNKGHWQDAWDCFIIDNCYCENVEINTFSTDADFEMVGGFIGESGATINKCYVTGSISVSSEISNSYCADVGGFVGDAIQHGIITNCYSWVDISFKSAWYWDIGGFVGTLDYIDISNCYSQGEVTQIGTPPDADNGCVGGFLGGYRYGHLTNCFSSGSVSVDDPLVTPGGFIGRTAAWATLDINNCSWWSGSSDYAIGTHLDDAPGDTLEEFGYGSDDATASNFWWKTKDAVYAQDSVTAWDFATGTIWYERYGCHENPTFHPCIVIDCGEVGLATTNVASLDHLEGMTVAILANGEVLDQQVVSDGEISLTMNYSKVTVGLPFESDLETLNVEFPSRNGTIQGKKVKIGAVTFRFVDTRGGWIGPDEDNLYEAILADWTGLGSPPPIYTGDVRVPLGAGYEQGGRIFYRQVDPLPVTISAVVPEVTVGGPSG